MKSKVLITGVAGLLGAHFSRYLLDQGHEVIGIDNLSGGYLDYVDPRLKDNGKFFENGLDDGASLQKIFADFRPDFVYHFAAYAAEGLSPFIRHYNYTNNLLCSANVINNCINYDVKKLIFTSSMAVYGHGEPPFRESQLPQPADPYGVAKYAVELDIHLAHQQFGLNYNIIRPHNVIGIYQNIWDKYRNVIGIWIRKSLAGENISVYGDGKQTRAFSDIKYYMEPFAKLMQTSECDLFNIGADKEYQLLEIAHMVQRVAGEFGLRPGIEHLESRLEVKDAFCNHDKAKTKLGFQDKTDIESTIREMFVWAKTQPVRETKRMPYEVEKGIYSFWK